MYMYKNCQQCTRKRKKKTNKEKMRHFFFQIVRFILYSPIVWWNRSVICVVFSFFYIFCLFPTWADRIVFRFIFSFLFHITLFFKSSYKIALARAAKALWVDIYLQGKSPKKSQFIAATGTFVLSMPAKVDAGLVFFFCSFALDLW